LPYATIATTLKDVFGEDVHKNTLVGFVERQAIRYARTEKLLTQKILSDSAFIHVDETTIKINGNRFKSRNLVLLYPKISGLSDQWIQLDIIDEETRVLIAGIDLSGIAGYGDSIKQQLDKLLVELTKLGLNNALQPSRL
jgi:hypothetical protein